MEKVYILSFNTISHKPPNDFSIIVMNTFGTQGIWILELHSS